MAYRLGKGLVRPAGPPRRRRGDLRLDALRRAYVELMMDEPGTPLEAFLQRATRGEFGPCDRDEIAEFLHQVGREMAASVLAQAEANPGLAAEADERLDQVRALIEDLLQRYGRPPG
jgi:hypothetical protein